MKLLALDTACGACSAAVWAHSAVVASRSRPMTRGHVEALLPMVEAVMAESGVSWRDLDLIAVTTGPGSFTGLRTGLAGARGLALALGLPLVGITTLEAVATAASHVGKEESGPARRILAAIETRRADLYVQCFSSTAEPLDAPRAASPADAAALARGRPTVLAGDGAGRLLEAWQDDPAGSPPAIVSTAGPDAAVVAGIAAARGAAAFAGEGAGITPLYLHPPEAKRPTASGRLRP